MKLRPIMFVGTGSDAGKSIMNTAFCRIFRQDGYRPAPFKAQNMSLNSFPTPEGGEIGRAQAVQAEACGVAPHTDMNPVLLKPTGEQSSQVVLNGRPVGNMSAREYFATTDKEALLHEALNGYNRLESRYNPMVLEGAGSISELNLRSRDIANMRMAREVGAATYLVADIDRGGVFASVYGSVMLLPEEERRLIKGVIINKFRGDISLFDEGRKMILELTGVPVVGVIPWFKDIHIEEEDSVALEMKQAFAVSGKINVVVVLFRQISNFTDFGVLERDSRFHVYYSDNVEEIGKADILILPGTKNTLTDLSHIRSNGVAGAVIQAYKDGKKVIGICGGYQMMGVRVEDPEHVESEIEALPGLGILPLLTVMENEKVTCQSQFRFKDGGDLCRGYQIHMGRTFPVSEADGAIGAVFGRMNFPVPPPLNTLPDGQTDGYWLGDHCWGSYMHGILDNPAVLNDLAAGFTTCQITDFDYAAYKQQQYDKLAAHVRAAVDMDYIYSTLKIGDQ